MLDKKKILLIALGILLIGVLWWRVQYLWSQPIQVSFSEVVNEIGGVTPQETLKLFTQAVEKNNPQLAAKYFNEQERVEWEKIMKDTFASGNFEKVAENLRRAQPEPDGIISDNFYQFITKDSQGNILFHIELIFNGQVWKIDSI